MHQLRTYLDLLRIQLLSRSQYRVDFWIGIVSSLLQHGATLAVLWLIFAQVPALGGWTVYQAMVLYGYFSLCVGLANVLANGLRELPQLVLQGELDGILVLPASPYVQLLPRLDLSALGDVAIALVVLISSAAAAGVSWSPLIAAQALLGVVSGTAILVGFMTGLYALAFWVRYPQLMHGLEGLTHLAQYPVTVYPPWLRAIITWVIPVAFASYYPAAQLTGAEAMPAWGWSGGIAAAVTAVCCGRLLWHIGLRKYEGTGS